jgi:TRAP transporter TatT component family protein
MSTTPACLLRRCLGLLCSLSLAGCASLHHYAVNRAGDALAASGTSYASDDDPELIRAAAPFSLKLIESLLADTPRHTGLLTAAAAGFTQYAYAYVQLDADELESRDVDGAFTLRQRARGLYLRGRDYGLRALESRHPGFSAALRTATSPAALASLDAADAPALYWTAIAWAAWISLSKDSAQALADLPRVDLLVGRMRELDAGFDSGAFQTFLISYQMGRPGARNPAGDARRSFARAVELSGGQRAGPFVALAETVCVKAQDRREFISNLQQALSIDPGTQPQWRLENRIMQQRARWLLTQTDQLFLE